MKLTEEESQRFWAKVNKTNGCWLWTGKSTKKGGFGSFQIRGENVSPHRISYMIHSGENASGRDVKRTCDNPSCVNPDHLFVKERSIPIKDRFWDKVDKSGDCWLWTGAKDKKGYGYVGSYTKNTAFLGTRLAHRISWSLHNNKTAPKHLVVRHKCDNPSCVNPEHLELGTTKDNIQDMIKRGRANYRRKIGEEEASEIKLLLEKGMSQRNVASIFNVSSSTISRIKLNGLKFI